MELISKLCIYTSAIRILANRYLPNTLITPTKLKEILNEIRKTLQVTNPNYYLVIDRLHLYYDMQLVTFGIDNDRNLIVQFSVFVQPYTQQPLVLYQLETVPVPLLTKMTKHIHTCICRSRNHILLQIQKHIFP